MQNDPKNFDVWAKEDAAWAEWFERLEKDEAWKEKLAARVARRKREKKEQRERRKRAAYIPVGPAYASDRYWEVAELRVTSHTKFGTPRAHLVGTPEETAKPLKWDDRRSRYRWKAPDSYIIGQGYKVISGAGVWLFVFSSRAEAEQPGRTLAWEGWKRFQEFCERFSGSRRAAEVDARHVLGVGADATPQEIKEAYRRLAMQHHPDRGGDVEAFRRVQEAYNRLCPA